MKLYFIAFLGECNDSPPQVKISKILFSFLAFGCYWICNPVYIMTVDLVTLIEKRRSTKGQRAITAAPWTSWRLQISTQGWNNHFFLLFVSSPTSAHLSHQWPSFPITLLFAARWNMYILPQYRETHRELNRCLLNKQPDSPGYVLSKCNHRLLTDPLSRFVPPRHWCQCKHQLNVKQSRYWETAVKVLEFFISFLWCYEY